jgi:DNA-binding response OmpR family regulator
LTGWGQEEDRRRTSEAGFDSHLTEPVGFARLLAIAQTAARADVRHVAESEKSVVDSAASRGHVAWQL